MWLSVIKLINSTFSRLFRLYIVKGAQLSFPVIHKVGNVDNFVLPKFANK